MSDDDLDALAKLVASMVRGPQHYKLDADRKPVPCGPEEAMRFRAENDDLCRVDVTQVGSANVSTVFLPFDHGWSSRYDDKPREPLIFETAIFTEDDVDIVGRVSTWERAEALHAATVMRLKAKLQ